MAVLEIVTESDPILRKKVKKITRVDSAIQKLANDMFQTMYKAKGVGLAAPQVNRSKRLVVVDAGDGKYTLVNPQIVAYAGEQENGEEGCLSIPGVTGDVVRYTEVTVKALDAEGKPIKVTVEGLTARAFQHEIDHLDGVLFIDKATNIVRK